MNHNDKRRIEDVDRRTEKRHRKTIDSIPRNDEGYDGEERMLGSDLVKKISGKWVKFSASLNGLEIDTSDDVPALKVTHNGRTFRLPFVEE